MDKNEPLVQVFSKRGVKYSFQIKNQRNRKMKIPDEVKISDNGFVFNSKTGDSFSLNPFASQLKAATILLANV